MYPFSYSNQDNSFSNYNLDNHSKPSQDYYQPNIFQQQQQRPLISSDHKYHDHTFLVAHEHSNPKTSTTNLLQSMNNSSYNNNYVILQNNILTGKRASKKDRHSKINTARGPRDRRMRLSLDVAKKFFKLQDMLGFDKASNTIEWLLMKSKPAIQDLLPNHLNNGSCSLISLSNSASSASECEVMSGIDDLSMEKSGNGKVIIVDNCSINKEKKRLDRGVRKSVYMHHSLAKETREQARARARKRTSEKRNNKLGGGDHAAGVSGWDQFAKIRPRFDQAMDQNVNRLGSWIPFGENQVQATDQGEFPSSHFQFKQGVVGDNSSGMPFTWSPSFLFNYQHTNSGPSHENQFNDFPILGKPWDQGNEN